MPPQPRATRGDSAWFVQARFGLFIHWGLYSLAARHEWVQSHEEIPPEVYRRRYFSRFNPTRYDPLQWAQAARAAGMKYAVITAKHHEGFCLWDTRYTDYKVTNTPYGRDVLREFVDAFRSEGLRIGFYYSLLDWYHPDFTIDIYHPLRNHPDAARLNAERDMRRYAEYVRQQVHELLTDYGPVDILWFDFSYPDAAYKGLPGKGHRDWESEKLVALVRSLCPKILLNNRLDLPQQADFYTPEQVQPRAWYCVNGEPVLWEACHTLGDSWGYSRDETNWKSPEQLIRLLIDSVACGGNLLLNVGPTPLGTLEEHALQALEVYRAWMSQHAESIYGCTQSDFQPPQDCRLTQRGNRLYVHLFAWPFKFLYLDGLANRVEYARFLHDGSEVRLMPSTWDLKQLQIAPDTLVLALPVRKPDVLVPVIELTLK